MQKLNMYCITIHDSHLNLIKSLELSSTIAMLKVLLQVVMGHFTQKSIFQQ